MPSILSLPMDPRAISAMRKNRRENSVFNSDRIEEILQQCVEGKMPLDFVTCASVCMMSWLFLQFQIQRIAHIYYVKEMRWKLRVSQEKVLKSLRKFHIDRELVGLMSSDCTWQLEEHAIRQQIMRIIIINWHFSSSLPLCEQIEADLTFLFLNLGKRQRRLLFIWWLRCWA